MYRNRNRGYQALRVWQDAIEFYVLSSKIFRQFPYDLKRVASQAVASSDSIHRNIAEGYCRRSLSEYLNFLNYALGSAGESVSGLHAYSKAGQLAENDFQNLDSLAFKLENGLLKLVESLEQKRSSNEWSDDSIVHESNAIYVTQQPDRTMPRHWSVPVPHHPITPSPHHPIPSHDRRTVSLA